MKIRLLFCLGILFLNFPFHPYAQSSTSKQEIVIDNLIREGKTILGGDDSIYIALTKLHKAYQFADSIGYTEGVISASYNLGRTYLTLSNNAEATTYYYMAMKRAEKLNDSFSMSQAYLGLGLVNYNLNRWDEAIDKFRRAKMLDRDKNSSSSKVALLDYLLGLCYHHIGNYAESNQYLNAAKKLAVDMNDTLRVAEIRLFQNHIAVEKGQINNVVEEYESLFNFFEKLQERVGMGYVKNGLARFYLKQNENVLALENAKEALVLVSSIDVIYPLQRVLEVMVEAEYANRNYKHSVDYMKRLNQLNDSVNSQSVSSIIAMLNADYQFQKKENQLNAELRAENRQKRWLLISLAGSMLTVLIIFVTLRTVAKERKRSDKLLLNILPKETAMELKTNGVAKAKRHEDVTVVFADVLNFTTIASKLSAPEIVRMLDRYFSSFDAVIQEFNLEKIKTIGDSYMFVSGLDYTENSAVPAAQASLKILKTIEMLKHDMEHEYGASFNFRVGMHTGNVVSGVVGHVKYAFDIWGDTVNVAARLESQSEAGKINVSESTYSLLKEQFILTPRGEVEIKNRGKIKMYFLTT